MHFYVYITTNKSNKVLYTGVTSNLKKRISEHKQKINPGFTQRYNANKLVYYQAFVRAQEAIDREKQIKAGSRQKKIGLIQGMNNNWDDLTTRL